MLISLVTPSLEGVSQRSQYHGVILTSGYIHSAQGVTSGRYWLCQFCHCLLSLFSLAGNLIKRREIDTNTNPFYRDVALDIFDTISHFSRFLGSE